MTQEELHAKGMSNLRAFIDYLLECGALPKLDIKRYARENNRIYGITEADVNDTIAEALREKSADTSYQNMMEGK